MSAESPSAAFLAGQQHGAQLAKQSAVPAKKTAAPVRKSAAQKSAAESRGTSAFDQLLAQAKALAAADTSSQVGAITAQQNTLTKQAQDRAQQINEASLAAAQFLSSLGDHTADSYTQAAKDLAGLAQGYSGEARGTAQAAADQVAQNLATLGSPTGALKTSTGETSSPEGLANVLYGVGGAIPAGSLLSAGQALAAAQRGLPASTLGYGQQQAAGTIAAGQQAANDLAPQLLAAKGGQGAAVRQWLSTLGGLANDQFSQKLGVAKYLTGIDEFNTRTDLQRQQLNLAANKFAQQTFNSDRNYALSLQRLGVSKKGLQLRTLAQEYKLQNGGFSQTAINKFGTDADFVASQALTAKKPPTIGEVMQQMFKRNVPASIAVDKLKATGLYSDSDITAALSAVGGLIKNGTASGDFGSGVGQLTSPFPASRGGVAGVAQSFLGVPYKWGGNDPKSALDCSAFIQQVFAKVGVKLPRTTQTQIKYGQPVALPQIQAGDVVFTRPGKNGTPNHVGLYIGNGQVQESPHTGDVNKVVSLSSFLTGGLVGIRRYANANG